MADDEDLEVLTREAQKHGLSLGRMLGDVIAEKASEVRAQHRPRLGTFHGGGDSIADRMESEDPAGSGFRG